LQNNGREICVDSYFPIPPNIFAGAGKDFSVAFEMTTDEGIRGRYQFHFNTESFFDGLWLLSVIRYNIQNRFAFWM